MDIPRKIQRLSEKPGAEWSPADVQALKDWLSQRQPMQVVWYYAARYLGKGASQQDIDDATVDLYMVIDQARMSYRPEGGPNFVQYLLNVCFRHNCVREGKKLRKRLGIEMPLEYEDDDHTMIMQIVDNDPESDPGRRAENLAFAQEIANFLSADRIPNKQRNAFILRYVDGMSYDEIAEKIGAPVGSVKSWISRATTAARNYMNERGWS